MNDHSAPAGVRRRLGLELRNLRVQAGKTGEDAASAAETSKARISRLENGKLKKFKDAEVRALLALYGVTDAKEQQRFVDMARKARQETWIDDFDDVIPGEFEPYVGLEAAAVTIRAYDDTLVNGLLQTEAYARAFLTAVRPFDSAETVDRLVQLRLRRQDVLQRSTPPKLWVIMEEAALRRPVGGKKIMRDQLQHLREIAKQPRVTLQVLPYAEGAHVGLDGPFTVLEFDALEDPDIVYVNSAAGNHYPRDVPGFKERFDLLRAVALSPARSSAFIEAVHEETK